MTDTPNPGSDAAIKQGCTCPVTDNHHGKGVVVGERLMFWRNEDCQMHGAKEMSVQSPKEMTMPDISMCAIGDADNPCPSRDKCYRFTANPSKPYQTYANFNDNRSGEMCAHFTEIWDRPDRSPKGDSE